MDVITFVPHPFHSQQNGEFFCREPPFAYFTESNDCSFSFFGILLLWIILYGFYRFYSWFAAIGAMFAVVHGPDSHGSIVITFIEK